MFGIILFPDQISILSELILTVLVFAFLYLTGYSFIAILAKIGRTKDPIDELATLQKVCFRLFIGMAFTFIFLSVLSIFKLAFNQECYLFLAAVIALSSFLFFLKLKEKHNFKKKIHIVTSLPTIAVIFVIFAVLIFSSNLISGYYGSTNDDGSYHTFKIRVIMDNPISLITHSNEPYASYTDIYPSLAHCLSASFVVLFGVPIQDIVIMFCAIMPSMISLAFFASMYTIFKNKIVSLISAILSGFFTLGYSWGPMAFNALPLLMSFFITISGLGLIFYIFQKKTFNWMAAFIISLVFIVALQTYYISWLVIVSWIITLITIKFSRQRLKLNYNSFRKLVNRHYLSIFGAFLIPATILVPYIITFYNNRNPALQNYPPDIPLQIFTSGRTFIVNLIQQRTTFNWPFDILATANFFQKFGSILSLSALAIIILPILFIVLRFSNNISKIDLLKGYVLSFCLFLLLMASLVFTTNTSIGKIVVSFVDPERMWQHIFITGVMLTSVAIFLCGFSLYSLIKRLLTYKFRQDKSHKINRLIAIFVLSIIIFNIGVIASSSLVPEFERNYNGIATSLNTFHSIGQEDLQMMYWIKDNIAHDSTILVSAGDSGEYLTSVTQIPTVYNYDNRVYSTKYQNLISNLSSNPLDQSVIQPMLEYNISYLYIGSIATKYSTDLNRGYFSEAQFKEVPYLNIVKQIANCYLFKFDQTKAKIYLSEQNKFDKCYFVDPEYAKSHVVNLENLTEYLDASNFKSLNAQQLANWMQQKIDNDSAPASTVIMTMGTIPDTIANGLSNNTLLLKYLKAGGRITWIGDVPLFYQSHSDGTVKEWGTLGALNLLGVDIKIWDSNATTSEITSKGLEWGMRLPNYATSQRPASNESVTTILASVKGYASSWQKNFDENYPNSGFICYSYADYDGSDNLRNRDVVNLATIPFELESIKYFFIKLTDLTRNNGD
jgi:hypothetical protein